MNTYDVDFIPAIKFVEEKFNNLANVRKLKKDSKNIRKSELMSGFIDLATFDDLQKIEDKIEDVVESIEEKIEDAIDTVEVKIAEIIVEAEPIIMTVVAPMIIAEVVTLAAPILAPLIVLAPIVVPAIISLATWEADQKVKATLQALIEKSKKKAIKKKA